MMRSTRYARCSSHCSEGRCPAEVWSSGRVGRSTAARVVMRSRIVLLASDGLQNKQIAKTLQVAPRMVHALARAFPGVGIEGLLKDAPRPGRAPSISAEVDRRPDCKTTQSTPTNATPMVYPRTMAKRNEHFKGFGVAHLGGANGLKPHRVESFKVSNDPNFADKLEAIVGLYLNPPEHALVLSVDEKSQISSAGCTQPGLPLKKGTRPDHDA